jgi:hypothetical protein
MRIDTQGTEQTWVLENDLLTVTLRREELALTVLDKKSGKTWEMERERETGGFTIQKNGIQIVKPLAAIPLTRSREVREGALRGWELIAEPTDAWLQFNVRVRVLLHETTGDLTIAVAPHEDPGHTADMWIREVHYPRSFVHSASPAAHMVVPLGHGVLLPGDLDMDLTGEPMLQTFAPWGWLTCFGPWWGHVDAGGAGYLANILTADDASFDFAHPAGGPTRFAPRWLTSFEAFRYERRIAYHFYSQADYQTMALDYRAYCQRIGRWRSIEEKRLEKPQLDQQVGMLQYAEMISIHSLNRKSIDVTFNSFESVAARAEAFALEHPGENLCVHLRGWQTRGYDHVHPQAVPPCPEAGGWEGMKKVSDVAAKHGMLFALHEQYRDYFLSSPYWSEELTRKDARRDSPRHHYWAGGTQSILCPELMLDFVKITINQLRDWHIFPNSTYQDVLTAIPLEECFDHRHPVSRTRCRETRDSIFEYYRMLGWLITSECAQDWAAPLLDSMHVQMPLINHGPCAKQVPGIPVPLYSLVFHDCTQVATWSNPPAPTAALFGINARDPENPDLHRLNQEAVYMPMTAHRFLSEDRQEQETVYGDAIRVRARLDTGAYSITGLKGKGEVAGVATKG